MKDPERLDGPIALRPVWLQLACAHCEHRAAVRLSDLFAQHLADYALFLCVNCNAVRSFERFGDPAAFAWRRRTIYLDVQAALDRLTPARLAGDPQSALRPRERIARCVRELETLDRYHGRQPPRCEECGVEHEPLASEGPWEYEITCARCGELPLGYRVIFAAPRGGRASFDGGVVCPVCGGAIPVAEALARPSASGDEVRCRGCGLTCLTDVDLRATPTRTVVRSLTLTATSAAIQEARARRKGRRDGDGVPGRPDTSSPPLAVALKRAALERGARGRRK